MDFLKAAKKQMDYATTETECESVDRTQALLECIGYALIALVEVEQMK